ncbi:hypothetical protein [Paraburkholderia phenoliruptrix]|uniref:hypothetical protein n=1 Tax=Paraburkholderia phenoliruptrix TaxID=252970 RepID=UPI001CB78DF8|nr:hypothetical protein [Paraburkholderia phenoliruptrix]
MSPRAVALADNDADTGICADPDEPRPRLAPANQTGATMHWKIKSALLAVSIAALTTGMSACKKVDDTSKDTTSSASSGVMSNSAGANGTSGESDAARRASDAAAGASGQAGGAASAASASQ